MASASPPKNGGYVVTEERGRTPEKIAFEEKMLALFKCDKTNELEKLVDKVSKEFIEADTMCTADVTEEMIADRFRQSNIPEEPMDVMEYFNGIKTDMVDDGIHTSCPGMIGHMTSALPNFSTSLAKLIVAMNQNVVKTETAKTVTFLEREALAKLHRLIFKNTEQFYADNIQNPATMLGLFTTGGTLANTSALWIARNEKLGASKLGTFGGVEKEGFIRAMKWHRYQDCIIIGSALMHYSLDKAADLLGVGVSGLVKIPVNANYQVNLEMMEERIKDEIAKKTLICSIVGVCGTTETGAIDDLTGMALLAEKYNIHFHVDAAWGGPCIFSEVHRHKAKGIELADSVTLDGHKQLWLPMGAGMVFLKDPTAVSVVAKSANYIIRKDSYDLGKFTIDGSRGAGAIYLHANLQLLGLKGYEVLFDRTVRVARYMARCIMRSQNFELLVKPMTNILLYRWLPASLREKAFQATLTDEESEFIDECNRKLQSLQKATGKTFVSRTTINAPKYNHKPTVGLRVVIGNPLTSYDDIDRVFWDQDAIIMSHVVTKDVSTAPEAIIDRDFGVPAPTDKLELRKTSKAEFAGFWDAVWDKMTTQQRLIFNNAIEEFYDAMITPDCFLDAKVTQEGAPWRPATVSNMSN